MQSNFPLYLLGGYAVIVSLFTLNLNSKYKQLEQEYADLFAGMQEVTAKGWGYDSVEEAQKAVDDVKEILAGDEVKRDLNGDDIEDRISFQKDVLDESTTILVLRASDKSQKPEYQAESFTNMYKIEKNGTLKQVQ